MSNLHATYLAGAVLAATVITSPIPAAAQAQGPVLKPSQVTENVLVEALGGKGDDGAATRSIRPTLKAGPAPAPAPGKASLLITFATGSADLSPETKNTLEVVAKALRSDRLAGLSFRVEGHADPRGTPEYNLKLSGERAEAVVAYLTGPLGVPADRLKPVGKGASELMDASRPEAAENRRVTIVTDR
jgi:outer membrane protein OmpA-like peptidoglycan-associated protein